MAGDPTITNALTEGAPVRVEDLGHVDLVVCGTVAVNRARVRVGKGGGYSDLELGLLVEAGLVDDATTIVTTVHPLQLIDEEVPETTHDFRVDIVVTPDHVIRTDARRRSPGVLWEHLDDETIEAHPGPRRAAPAPAVARKLKPPTGRGPLGPGRCVSRHPPALPLPREAVA